MVMIKLLDIIAKIDHQVSSEQLVRLLFALHLPLEYQHLFKIGILHATTKATLVALASVTGNILPPFLSRL